MSQKKVVFFSFDLMLCKADDVIDLFTTNKLASISGA